MLSRLAVSNVYRRRRQALDLGTVPPNDAAASRLRADRRPSEAVGLPGEELQPLWGGSTSERPAGMAGAIRGSLGSTAHVAVVDLRWEPIGDGPA